MNKTKHVMMLFVLVLPLLAVFTSLIGRFIGFIWGFVAWTIVLGQWNDKEGPVFGIKNDTLLQQHNKEAEEQEVAEQQTPQHIVEDVRVVDKGPEFKNPFAR